LVQNLLPRDTIRITKHHDQVRIDFSNLTKIVNPSKQQSQRDFSLIFRDGAKYRSSPIYETRESEPSLLFIDWTNGQCIDLLDPELELDEHVLMIRRIMIHKKVITQYVKGVESQLVPAKNVFGRYKKQTINYH
jgi:hypothetical protein